jgi:hypothetical protein
MKDNFSVEYDEWFSPHGYKTCLDSGTATNKNEYINYIYTVTAGDIDGHAIKITNDICADEYWGENLLKNDLFISSIKKNDGCLLLLRNNILNAISSLAYSIKTNHWHSISPNIVPVLNTQGFPDSQQEFITKLALEYIDSELRMIEFITSHIKNFNVIYYEDLLDSPSYFSLAVIKSLVPDLGSNFKLKMPNIKKIKKEPKVTKTLDRELFEALNSKDMSYLRELYSYRNNRFVTLGILEKHAFYKNILLTKY